MPNIRGGPNKQGGWKNLPKLINGETLIRREDGILLNYPIDREDGSLTFKVLLS